MFYLVSLFILVPIIELSLLFRVHDIWLEVVGRDYALLMSLGIILVTGIVGARFAKQQGGRLLFSIQTQLQSGQVPTDSLIEGALVLVGGVLLITPGYITDFVGLSCVFPLSRVAIRDTLKKHWSINVQATFVTNMNPSPPPTGNDTIDVEVIDHEKQDKI